MIRILSTRPLIFVRAALCASIIIASLTPTSAKHLTSADNQQPAAAGAGAGNATPQQPAPATSPSAPATPPAIPPAGGGGGGGGGGGAKICREVSLGPIGVDVDALAAALKNSDSNVTVTALGKRILLLCGPPANIDVVTQAVAHLSGKKSEARPGETHYVRLFFFRHAPELATDINNSAGLSTPVKAVGDDLLLFTSESDSDTEAIRKLKRWIAMVDVPRPEVSLLAWSAQISSTDRNTVRDKSNFIRSVVSLFNEELQNSVSRGWEYLEEQRAINKKFFAPIFQDYVTDRYLGDKRKDRSSVTSKDHSGGANKDRHLGDTSNDEHACAPDKYCLGYTQLLEPVQPSLGRMLLTLIGSQQSGVADGFVNSLEGRYEKRSSNLYHTRSALLLPSGSCEDKDDQWLRNHARLGFYCFREQLNESMGRERLPQLRVALADFLFQYKSASFYPEDFTTWNQAASAQALDTRLNPLIVAFNRDLAVYLRGLQQELETDKIGKKVSFAADGIITARVVSGNPVHVETTTQSHFDMPPTLSARDLFAALKDQTASLSPVITGHAAELIAAAMAAEQRTTAKVGRDFNLQITANTLQGASACEMDVTLNNSESDKPSLLNTTKGTASEENLNRVAKHNITTKVRVDSQKVFEISSFESALVHGKSVPLLPPFVDLPYIGNLARLRLPPGTVYHQSFAIVSAVIVPTAADLANTIEFRSDVEPTKLEKVSMLEKPDVARPQTLYYWIVAHYKTGDSLSGPFPVTGVTGIGKTQSVTLNWRAPLGAQSFDVLRTKTGGVDDLGKNSIVQLRTTKPTFTDALVDDKLQPYFVPLDTKLPRVTLRSVPVVSNLAPPPSGPTQKLYYWIVAHYNEGDSVSDPIVIANAPQVFDDEHSVTLAWRMPDNARSFEILRATSNDLSKSKVVADEVEASPYIDRGGNLGDADPLPNPDADAVTFRRINRLKSNLNEFHKRQLDCIAKEARSLICEEPKLSTTPAELRY